MPKRRPPTESPLERALRDVRRALDGVDARWMVIGAIAAVAAGVRRMTTDIDVVVDGRAVSVDVVAASLAEHGIVARIPGALAFARENLVLLARHRATGVDVDVALAHTSFEARALASRRKAAFGAASAPMARPIDLVVLKLAAGRAKDIDDARTLLALHPRIDIARVRRDLREIAELADAPEMTERLDPLLAEIRSVRRKR